MHSRRKPGYTIAACLIFMVCSIPVRGQGLIVVDGSGSMAGFAQAAPDTLRGTIQRIYSGLSGDNADATKAVFMEVSGENLHDLKPAPIKDVTRKAGEANLFKGDTPLQTMINWSRHQADEFVVITDGMENDGRISGVIQILSEMANSDWGIGIVAVQWPFRGIYYTEMEIPLGSEEIKNIQTHVKRQNTNWEVSRTSCPHGHSNCYYFNGARPLLFIVFSKDVKKLRVLFKAVEEALKENRQSDLHSLQLAPFREVGISIEILPGSVETTRVIRLPDLTKDQHDLRCSAAMDKGLPLNISVKPEKQLDPPQPSALVFINGNAETRPAWVSNLRFSHSGNVSDLVASLDVACQKPSLWTSMLGPPWIEQSGKLELAISEEWKINSSGWWVDTSAADSWSLPFRTYRLADLIAAVHSAAMSRFRTTAQKRNIALSEFVRK